MCLTVGFDATPAYRQSAGIGRYTRELLRALAERDDDLSFRVYYCAGGTVEGSFPELNGRFKVRSLPVTDRFMNVLWHRSRLPVPAQLIAGRFDLFHAPDFTLPPTMGTPTVLTIHDLAFLARPECAYPTLRAYLNQVVPRSVRHADRIIAVSENTRHDLVQLLGVAPERIISIPEGVDPAFCQLPPEDAWPTVRRLGIDDPFILSLGTIEPRKNYVRLLEAYASLRRQGVQQRLVIAGREGWMYQPFYRRLDELQLRAHVTLIRPADAVLPALYSAADLFVYPSLYEGFGIPPLEALACGTAVACSETSSLPEVVGDAALLFDPTDVEQIAGAVARLLSDGALRRQLRERGKRRARAFSWARTAEETVRVYRTVVGNA